MYKETVKAVAEAHDIGATFRPHPFPELPGTDCHIHLSVWQDDENVLYDPDLTVGTH
ncbi:hypothetical protein ACFQMF_15330 [Halorubrum rutilum]|uniref:GS catalytic domain-containing protein n=1 Tax=Halorubrum rutilum TaxID=1364933 RepID=A0ABD6APB3_9EURY